MDKKNVKTQATVALFILFISNNVTAMNPDSTKHCEKIKKFLEEIDKETDKLTDQIKVIKKKYQDKLQNKETQCDIQIASSINGLTYILDQLIPDKVTKKLNNAAQYNQTVSLLMSMFPFHNQIPNKNPWQNALIKSIKRMGLSLGADYILEREPIKKIITQYISPQRQTLCKSAATVTMIGTAELLLEKIATILYLSK